MIGRTTEYKRAKTILNAGRHPTFIGRDMVCRNAVQGGLIFAVVNGTDAAVSVINVRNSTLLVFCVHPAFRKCGLGSQFIQFLRPNFARVVESAVAWFERNGYKQVGNWKQGRILRTAIMVRGELIDFAGRAKSVYQAGCPCARSNCTHGNKRSSRQGTSG